MIIEVKLKNWKSHRETVLKFGDGTNVLIGSMGSGKSSVLDAIAYALFGTLPGIKNRKFKLEDLIMAVPQPEQHAEVEVTFRTPEEEDYVVKRRIERGRGTVLAELRKADGSLIENGSERVTEHVCELLKITYDVYERAIYSEQNQLDLFLEIKKGKRRESIDELLGIRRYEKARKNMGTVANRLQGMAGEKDRELRIMKQDPSLAQMRALEEEIRSLLEQAEIEQERAQQYYGQLQSTKKNLAQMKELEKQISDLRSGLMAVQATTRELEKQVESLRKELGEYVDLSLPALKEKLDEWTVAHSRKKEETGELERKRSRLEGELGRLDSEIKTLQRKNTELQAQIEEKERLKEEFEKRPLAKLEEELKQLKEDERRIADDAVVARSQIRELERAVEELQGAGAQCPVCESPLDEQRKAQLLEKRRKTIDELKLKVRELTQEKEKLEKRIREAEREWKQSLVRQKELEQLPVLREQLVKNEKELQEKMKKLEEIEKEKTSIDKLLSSSREELERIEKELRELEERKRAKEKLEQNMERLREFRDEFARVSEKLAVLEKDFDLNKLRELEQRVQELSDAHARTQELAKKKRELAEEKRKRLEEVKKKQQLIQRLEREVKALRDFSQLMSALQQATSRVQVELRKYFLDSVNEVMNDIWRDLYPYGDFTGIRLVVDEEANDYVLQLRDLTGKWRPVDGGVSGGERSTACLALRVAFSMVLAPSLRWIVFDEPTHNLDARGVEELARVLRERLPQIVRQVLLITHNEKLEEAVSGFLYKFYREKGKNEPTRYELVTSDLYGGM